MSKNFYVYHFHPTPRNPYWHYGYFAMDLPSEELPDIRYYRPKWIYNDQTRTYVVIDPANLWQLS